MTKSTGDTILSEKAFLVKLTISQWSAKTTDKAITAEIAKNHDTDEAIGKFHKNLIRSKSLDKFRKHAQMTRELHYAMTLPWSDGGMRMLPVMRYEEYQTEIRAAIDDGKDMVREFLEEYDECVERSKKAELKDLAKDYEFPSVDKIRSKFAIYTTQMPIPAQGGGWPSMLREVEGELNNGYEKMVQSALQSGEQELWVRIHRYVSRMHARLSDPDQSFRRTLVSKLRDLVQDIPKMNIGNNADIASMIADIEQRLVGEEFETLRDEKDVRKQVADDAGEILEKMAVFYTTPS